MWKEDHLYKDQQRWWRTIKLISLAVRGDRIASSNFAVRRTPIVARTVNLRKLLIWMLVFGAVTACAAVPLFLMGDPLRAVNVFIPLAILGALWAIWLRQRQHSAATQARINDAAEVYASGSNLTFDARV